MHAATSKMTTLLAGLLAAAVPALASAQGHRASARDDLLTPYGEYLLLGGGVAGFTASDTKDRFDTGGTWDVRLGLGSRSWIGGELAYVGSARNGKAGNADLVTNGGEAVLRLQYPWDTAGWLVEPFAFGGIGWTHGSLRNAAPGLKTSGDTGIVPFGAGVTFGRAGFLVDARFTYRASFSEDLAVAPASGKADLSQWSVGASVGYEF
jgi:hypothetical protein